MMLRSVSHVKTVATKKSMAIIVSIIIISHISQQQFILLSIYVLFLSFSYAPLNHIIISPQLLMTHHNFCQNKITHVEWTKCLLTTFIEEQQIR